MLKKKVILSIVSICVLVVIIFTAFKMGQKTQVNEAKSINSSEEVSVSNKNETKESSKTLETELSTENPLKTNVLEITENDDYEDVSEELQVYLDFVKAQNRAVDVIQYGSNNSKDETYEDITRDIYENSFDEEDTDIDMISKGSGVYDVLARETDSLLYFEPSADLPYFDLYLKNGNTVKARNTTIDEIGKNLKIDKSDYDKLWVYNYETEKSGTTNYFLITQKGEDLLITLHTFKQEVTEQNRLAESLISLKPVDMKNATDKKDFKEVIGIFKGHPELLFLLKKDVLVDKNEHQSYVANTTNIHSSNANSVIFALDGFPEAETQFRYAQMLMLAMFDRYFLDYYYDFRESM